MQVTAKLEQDLTRLEKLNAIGKALSAESNITRLLEMILDAARSLTNADAGTLYRLNGDGETAKLAFDIVRTDSLGIALGGLAGKPINFPPVPLYKDGAPNNAAVAAYAVLHSATVNIADAYSAKGFDFSGTRAFDKSTGYRSKSFLTVPLKNHQNEIIAVLQLINAIDPATGAIVPFSQSDQMLVESLASQAAIALTNRQLIDQLTELFESFIQLINIAIDEKSPYTGGHCQRVPALAMMLADAADRTAAGPLASFRLSEQDRYELKIAALLHDCGKVVTPVHVVDKATKLQTIFDRIELIDTRFEVLKRDARIELLQRQLEAKDSQEKAAAEDAYGARLAELDSDREFLRKCNLGGDFMSPELQKRVAEIAARRWTGPSGNDEPFLTEEEVHNLNIARGTLTPEEREIISYHVVATIKMLEALPWPKHLRHVPEYAGCHHERADGKGYPRGLTLPQMSIQARIMAIADIFEALTAKDRPYKPGKTLTEALTILGRMKLEGHVDPDLFDTFVREGVYLKYAQGYLDPEQVDEVDLGRLPGYRV